MSRRAIQFPKANLVDTVSSPDDEHRDLKLNVYVVCTGRSAYYVVQSKALVQCMWEVNAAQFSTLAQRGV